MKPKKSVTHYGTSVRFDPEIQERLKRVSERSGIKIAKLIRLATERYLDECEDSEKIVVPLRKVAETPAQYGRKETGGD